MMNLHLYLHTPAVVFKARVNLALATYPLTEITFDTVTVGAYTDIAADMTLLLGTTEGGEDLGRVRVQNVATSTTIPIGRVSEGNLDGELIATNDAYITVLDDYRVWSKIPYIAPDGTTYRDSTVEVNDYTGDGIPPVANCGPGFADYIDSDTEVITVRFDGGTSFAVADGATIDTFAWDVGDGTITIGTSSSAAITATFPAGFRWVALTVTDSNGTPHTSRCPVLAVDADDDVSLPYGAFQITRHEVEQSGQEIEIRFVQDIARATYRDGMLVMLWSGAPVSPSDRYHMEFIGWHQSDQADVRATRTGTLKETTLRCVDVAGRMKTLPGFPQYLERKESPANWQEMKNPTMDKYLHYLMLWHGTALGLADYFPSDTGDSYPFVLFDSDGESLYEQINNEARRLVPQHTLTCNRRGQLAIVADPMLQDLIDRTTTIQATFTEDYTESITFDVTRPPRVHWLRGHAILASTEYVTVDDLDAIITLHCIAPGTAPGQGLGEVETTEGLARNQTALNNAKGHEYARLNSPYGRVRVVPPDENTYALVEPANLDWTNLTVTAATAAQRGYTFTNTRTQCQRVSFRYENARTGAIRRSEFELEIETIGKPALTVVPDGAPEPLITIPPTFGLVDGVEKVAGIDLDGNVYRTADFQTDSGSGGPTWEQVSTGITETIYSFVVDPFSPGYAPGATTGAINGWVATEDAIYRLTDIFGTLAVDVVCSFATTADAASYHWRTIQASFGAYFGPGLNPWLLCISYYGNTGGRSGTWATYSLNGGVTWSTEVEVSEFYSTATPARFMPIAVFTSPRTPGLAYTAAYTESNEAAVTDGYVSTDWGATWSRLSAEVVDDPAHPLPSFAVYTDGTPGSFVNLGKRASASLRNLVLDFPGGGTTTVRKSLVLAAPPDASVVVISGSIYAFRDRTGGLSSASVAATISNNTNASRVTDLSFSQPALGSSFQQDFTLTWTKSGTADWNVNTNTVDTVLASGVAGCRILLQCIGNASGDGNMAIADMSLRFTVTSITLEDGTTYTPPEAGPGIIQPGYGLAGTIHVPWQGNTDESLIYYGHFDDTVLREFALKKSDGGVITDISPTDGTRNYGVNRGHFGVRTYDSNRQYVLAAVAGNDSTSDPDDDMHAVYISGDYGDTWMEVVAPIADSGAPTGRPAFEAAFGGDSEQIVFVWGPPDTIGYSDDMGATLDDRSGNLSGAGGFVGICGGPSA